MCVCVSRVRFVIITITEYVKVPTIDQCVSVPMLFYYYIVRVCRTPVTQLHGQSPGRNGDYWMLLHRCRTRNATRRALVKYVRSIFFNRSYRKNWKYTIIAHVLPPRCDGHFTSSTRCVTSLPPLSIVALF